MIPKKSYGTLGAVRGKTVRRSAFDEGRQRGPRFTGPNLFTAVAQQGAQQNRMLSDIGDTLFKFGKVFVATNERIKEQSIKNQIALEEANLSKDFLTLEQEMKDTEIDVSDYEEWWKAEADKLFQVYKKKFDGNPEAWNRFLPTLTLKLFAEGYKSTQDIKLKKVNAQTFIAYQATRNNLTTEISKLKIDDNIWMAMDVILNKFKPLYVEFSSALGTDRVDLGDLQGAHLDIWKKIVTNENTYFDYMDSAEYTDNTEVVKKLKTGVYNKFLGRDNPFVDELIVYFEGRAQDHAEFKQNRDVRLNGINGKELENHIKQYFAGKAELTRREITDKINAANITKKYRVALLKELKLKKEDSGSYGDSTVVDEFIKQIIKGTGHGTDFQQAVLEEKNLTARGRKFIMDYATKWHDNMTESAKTQISSFLDQFDNKLNQLLQPHLDSKVLSAEEGAVFVGYLNTRKRRVHELLLELISHGEKAGVSYDAMLNDSDSDYYILDRLQFEFAVSGPALAELADQISVGKYATFEGMQQYWNDKAQDVFKFFIDADYNNKSALSGRVNEPSKDLDTDTQDESEIAVFLERRKNEPQPPPYVYNETQPDGSIKEIKIPIGEYSTSKVYIEFRRAYGEWLKEGGYTADGMPKIYRNIAGQAP
jgi:hypothetical protein